MYNENNFTSRAELDTAFAQQVAQQLEQAIAARGQASIAFSGGSTPKGFFAALSQQDIAWDKVTVTLADDRWVATDHKDSNDKLLRENLLQHNAASATVFSLVDDVVFDDSVLAEKNTQVQSILPLDVVVLGMGEDGHTASIFPCSAQVAQGLDESKAPCLMATQPTTAPYQRITFNFPALINATHVYLHIVGDSKKHVLADALASKDALEMPIRAFLHHPEKTIDIFWAE